MKLEEKKIFRSGLYYTAVLLGLLCSNVFAQKENKIAPILEASDLKKTEKAQKLLDDADKLMEDANRLYMETFTIQGDYSLDEKARKKKVKKIEEEARAKITEASALYKKGNETLFTVYKSYIEKFWAGHTGEETVFQNARLVEEQSNDLYYQAVTSYQEAEKMPDGNEKIQKLTQAHEYEIQAVDKQMTALAFYYNIDQSGVQPGLNKPGETYEPYLPAETAPAQTEQQMQPYTAERQIETTVPGQVVINQSMIDMYNRYMSSSGHPEDSVSTTGFKNISSFDADRILQLWYAYRYGTGIAGTETGQPAPTAETETTAYETAANQTDIQNQQQAQYGEQVTEEPVAVIENERQAQQLPADENIIYRIQIAANRTELNQGTLQRMYYGNKSIEMIEEDGWFKYSVGDFDSYTEANKFRKSCGIKNAFIVAYRKGTRFIPSITGEAYTSTPILPSGGSLNMPSGLVFRIQIAASRAPLTREQVRKIYPGTYPVEMIEEDGWFKYQLLGVRLFSDALGILKDIPVKGAFVSAYVDGIKVNLYEAVVKNRDLERSVKSTGHKGLNETEFHVQLAASRFPINRDDFNGIYSGTEPVALVLEEGWYKYRIKAGNSYDLAKKTQAECGIEKAFIIAYKRAVKIPLFEAIHDPNP